MIRRPSFRLKDLVCGLGMLIVLVQVAVIHRWFAQPFAVWIGCDEAYIAAFGERLIEGRWIPYVDAVSHRGPVLYWVSALLQWFGGHNSWLAVRAGAFVLTELSVVGLFAIGALAKRPLAGFLGAAVFSWATTFALPPHDGIALNGEIVAVPFALGATILTLLGVRESSKAEARLWLAAGTGALAVLAGLSKQPAFLHLAPLALWWAAALHQQRDDRGKADWRPLGALCVGAATPLLAVLSFYARSGHLQALQYYFLTYNRKVYLSPITLGVAIEAWYGFCRTHAEWVVLTVLAGSWWFAKLLSGVTRFRSLRCWLTSYGSLALLSTVTLHALLAFAGACSTFRFFDHYFVTAVPWFGLLVGVLVEDQLSKDGALTPKRLQWIRALMVGSLCLFLLVMGKVHLHWLDGQRRMGFFGDPRDEPITNYVIANSRPTDRIFAWGFAPEYYISAKRRAASRYVYTTFVAGLVPWFERLSVEQEDALAVPGSRDILLRELEAERTELLLDVPNSLRNRSLRRYEELARYLEATYCYEATIVGRNGHTADVYRRKRGACARPLPPR